MLWALPLACLALGAGVLMRRRAATARTRRAVANTRGLTDLPHFRHALAAHRRRLWVATALGVFALLATTVGAARPFATTTEQPETRNRDIMLCLDISGSMAKFDATLVTTFQSLATKFHGERIGMVIFNGSAATVFPLTDDYEFVDEQLREARAALEGTPGTESFFSGTFNSMGTSLIGDGVATCVSGFDKQDEARPRSLILATDNHLAGYPFIDLVSAGELAKSRSVRIYALNPADESWDPEARELQSVAEGTGGGYFAMTEQSESDSVTKIVAGVQAQEAKLLKQSERTLRTDTPAVPIALAGAGLAGLVLASRRVRQ